MHYNRFEIDNEIRAIDIKTLAVLNVLQHRDLFLLATTNSFINRNESTAPRGIPV